MNKTRKKNPLAWAFLAAVFALVLVWAGLQGSSLLTEGVATDLVLAQTLKQDGGLLSGSFLYGDDARILSPVTLYRVFMMLLPGSWTAVRVLTLAVLLAALAASFLFMARGAGLQDSAVWAAGIILLPVSTFYGEMVSFGGRLLGPVILSFLAIGLLLRTAGDQEAPLAARILRWILLGLCFLLLGLQGTGSLLMCAVPMAASALCLFVRKAWTAGTADELFRSRDARLLIWTLLGVICTGVGFIANIKVLAPRYGFATGMDQAFSSFTVAGLQKQVDGLAMTFGWVDGMKAASLGGLLSLLGVVLSLGLMICGIVLCFRGEKMGLTPAQHTLAVTAFVSMAIGMAVNTMCGLENAAAAGAWLTGLMLLVLSAFVLIERLPLKLPGLNTVLAVVAALMFLIAGCGTITARPEASSRSTLMTSASLWLRMNGLEKGFALSEDANMLTAASDGQLEVWIPAYMDAPTVMASAGQRRSHAEQLPEGPVFLVFTGDADKAEQMTAWMGRDAEWQAGAGDLTCLIYTAGDTETLIAPLLQAPPEGRS